MWKRCWRPETGLFLAIWLVLLVGGRSRFFQDPGTFWHTVVGEQMLSSGRLIYQDTFSFTFAGQRWSPHQWLGECVMALLNRLDGLDSLLLATVTVLAGLYTWLAIRAIRGGLHWSLAGVLVALTLAASSSHFHIRPHIGTIVGLGVTFGFLTDYEARRIPLRKLFWLVPVYVLWTNIHGGMLGGLATIILAVVGWTVARMIGRESPLTAYRQLLPLSLLSLACGLTAFVNPYGTRLPQIWLEIMDSPVLPKIIAEHAPLNLAKPDGLMVLVLALTYFTVLASTMPRWPRVTWLLPLVWLVQAWFRVRHAPLFAVTAGLAVADMIPHTRWAAALARKGSDLFQLPALARAEARRGFEWRPALVPLALVLLAFGLQTARWSVPVIGHGWARLDPAYWPVELEPMLERFEHARADGTPVFNEYLFGGFLIYYTPGYRVLVDDRCELYGDCWLDDYVRAEWDDTEGHVRAWERQYPRFDLALTRSDSGFDRYFGESKEWTLVRRTDAASLYQRKAASVETAKEIAGIKPGRG